MSKRIRSNEVKKARQRLNALDTAAGITNYGTPKRVIPLDEAKTRLLARFKKAAMYSIEITIWPKNDPKTQVRANCGACGTTAYGPLLESKPENENAPVGVNSSIELFINSHTKCYDED